MYFQMVLREKHWFKFWLTLNQISYKYKISSDAWNMMTDDQRKARILNSCHGQKTASKPAFYS